MTTTYPKTAEANESKGDSRILAVIVTVIQIDIRNGEAQIGNDAVTMRAMTDDAGYERGDRVEAKVSGWTKYYAGEITRVNRDGTYDIKFDDGERKSGVKSSQIKSKGTKSKKKSSSRRSDDESDADDAGYERGDRVEAKVSGWTKYYGGEITRVNRDGTYDIKFDDGERKSGVKSSQIKSKE